MPATAPIVHLELKSADFQRSAQFYQNLFGWQTQAVPEMNYLMFKAEGGPGGGFVKPERTQAPGCLAYLQVDDIDAKLADIEKAGGRVILPKEAIGEMGFQAIFADLDGNTVGLYMAPRTASAPREPSSTAVTVKTTPGKKPPAKPARPAAKKPPAAPSAAKKRR